MNNSIDIKKLVAIAGDESTKQGAYIGVDTDFFTTYGELYHQAKCKQADGVYQEYNPLISYWMDCDKDTYEKATERRVLYTTPQQPQSVADALEEAVLVALSCEYQSKLDSEQIKYFNAGVAALYDSLIKRNATKEGE